MLSYLGLMTPLGTEVSRDSVTFTIYH
ncbi:hypothetical protein LINPERPRIM_LOCUS25298 [Linum perenne]